MFMKPPEAHHFSPKSWRSCYPKWLPNWNI